MDAWKLLSIILSLAILISLIYFLYAPTQIKYLFKIKFPRIDYVCNANGQIFDNYTLYAAQQQPADNLLIVFIGGAALYSRVQTIYGFTNELYDRIGEKFDILTFSYPVRFKNTVRDMLIYINAILQKFLHYKNVHACGISFGTLLAGAFIKKEGSLQASKKMQVPQIGMNVKSLSGFSGLYGTKFNSQLLTNLFKFYVMRQTPGIEYYSCYNLAIPTLAISSSSDFLVAQTFRFAKREGSEVKIFQAPYLRHAFVQVITLDEAKQALDMLAKFLLVQ